MNEKRHHFHALTIYDPNNLDHNKDSPVIPSFWEVVYVQKILKKILKICHITTAFLHRNPPQDRVCLNYP